MLSQSSEGIERILDVSRLILEECYSLICWLQTIEDEVVVVQALDCVISNYIPYLVDGINSSSQYHKAHIILSCFLKDVTILDKASRVFHIFLLLLINLRRNLSFVIRIMIL